MIVSYVRHSFHETAWLLIWLSHIAAAAAASVVKHRWQCRVLHLFTSGK
jgi:hypothetical protein